MTIRYRPIAIAIGTALFCPAFTLAQTPVMDEVLVSATRMELAYPLGSMTVGGDGIVRQRPYTSDSAGLLKDVPGFSSYAGGGVAGHRRFAASPMTGYASRLTAWACTPLAAIT